MTIEANNESFDIDQWKSTDHPLSPEEEFIFLQEIEDEEGAEQKEKEAMLLCCGSCKNFISIMAEAGLCKLNKDNCVCKNPKAFIDMFDAKCDKWE